MSLAGHAHLKGLWTPIVLILPAVACPMICLPDRAKEERCRCLGRTTADTKRSQKHANAEINMLSLKIALEIIEMTDGFNGVAWTGTCVPGASTLRLTRYSSVVALMPIFVCSHRMESKYLFGMYAPSPLKVAKNALTDMLLGVLQSSDTLSQ